MIITITGPSGSGKSSLVRLMKKKYGAQEIISTTTRAPRKREKDGVDYRFVDKDSFDTKKFFEHTFFDGNYYGKTIEDVKAACREDFDKVFLVVVDRAGMEHYKKHARNTYSVYLETTPEFAEANLVHRDGKKKAKARIKEDAQKGLFCRNGFDCIIDNDESMTLDALAYQLQNFIISLQLRRKYKLLKKEAA